MSEKIGWQHPTDESDQWDGFNDPGIETFRGSPIKSLAREINQNSLDALDHGEIVVVKITLSKVLTTEIPNVDELRSNFNACLEASKGERKAEIFFTNGLKGLDKKEVPVLTISDYNTTGMKGPSENGTPFYAFMKAKGQSKKESDDAGGSYGIGKLAPYAVSKLRTIFLSTIYESDSGEFIQLTQGKSILMSHDKDGNRKQGVGFWGVKKRCQPIKEVGTNLPDWLVRSNSASSFHKNKGSKLSVLFFDEGDNWQTKLATSVAENFFGAIYEGRLRVEIDDEFTLEQSTIVGFFQNEEIYTTIEAGDKDSLSHFKNCNHYLSALKKDPPEVVIENTQNAKLGHCRLTIFLGEELPKKVCFLRNGMFITDALTGLKRFGNFKEFVAVFHCLDSKGNQLLRAMEPPRHDDFEPDRLPTAQEQKEAKRALRDISEWVRKMLHRHAKDPVTETTTLDELKNFFYEEGSANSGKGTEEINPYGEVKLTGRPIKLPSLISSVQNQDGGGSDDVSNDGGGGKDGAGGGDGKGGVGTGEGGSSSGKNKGKGISVDNVRAILTGNKSRKISFTPTDGGKILIHVKQAGADSDYNIGVVESSAGEILNGSVCLDVIAGERLSLDISLNKIFAGALKVTAHEI